MDQEIKAQWVAALRSGRYKQGRGVLHHKEDKYCCLGVLCDLAVEAGVTQRVALGKTGNELHYYGFTNEDGTTTSGYLPDTVCKWATLPSCPWAGHASLAVQNDSGASFERIADLIERDL